MKRKILSTILASLPLLGFATGVKQNRGLMAFANGNKVQVEWRMRATDNPTNTQYQLYIDGNLYGTFRSKTTALVNKAKYGNSVFSLVVKDKDGNEIDRQEGIRAWESPFLDIPMEAPVVKDAQADTALVTYTPLDASAYDMDGDGEQEIVIKWQGQLAGDGAKPSDNHEFVDCYKLNGKRLWRIDFGQNVISGNNFTFMVWDFDGDGKGEMIVKTAPGTKDAQGNFVGKGLTGYPEDLNTVYYRGSDGAPTAGEEWITCFDGVTGKELASRLYWPYFGIQENWDTRNGRTDGMNYGRRGNGFKGAVIKIPCRDGKERHACYMQRGIYTYVYATAISWDGTSLTEEWRVSSTSADHSVTENAAGTHTQGISLFAEGAHSGEAGDIDGDGYDEVCIGAAAIDHDGKVLWSTGFGHGDVCAVGEFNPGNAGLEAWRITEASGTYNACMLDGASGTVLNGQARSESDGDVSRGIIMDLDSTHVGHEYWHNASKYVYDCNGNELYEYNRGNNTGYPNFSIFWDGDLMEEHFDGNGVAKFDIESHNWVRATFGRGNTDMLWKMYKVHSINSTKGNACLVCDLLGDFREELVMYANAADADRSDCDYVLRIVTTTYDTDKKLPWLRDDKTYDLQIASQNVGYSMPPHISYNAHEWYGSLGKMGEDEIAETEESTKYFKPVKGAYYSVSIDGGVSLNLSGEFSKGFAPLDESSYEIQFVYVTDSTYILKGSDGQCLIANGGYGYKAKDSEADATPFIGYVDGDYVYFKSTTDPKSNGNVWVIYDSKRMGISRGTSEDSAFRFTVKQTGNHDATGITTVKDTDEDKGDAWHSIGGASVGKPGKGVYVKKGRKVLF